MWTQDGLIRQAFLVAMTQSAKQCTHNMDPKMRMASSN